MPQLSHPPRMSAETVRAICASVWVTLLVVLVSLLVTTGCIYLVEGTTPTPLALFVATVTPALIVPGACFVNLRLLYELRAANERLAALSETDSLTKTLNRRRFLEVAERELVLAARHQYPTTVVLIDFDNFKVVNDQHGHHVGDEVLIRSIEVMHSVIRQSDVLGRFGGEEFILLLPHTSAGGALALVDRLREAVAGNPVVIADGDDLRVTISAGCLTCESSQSSLAAMVQKADELLYQSKANGRDRCTAGTTTHQLRSTSAAVEQSQAPQETELPQKLDCL